MRSKIIILILSAVLLNSISSLSQAASNTTTVAFTLENQPAPNPRFWWEPPVVPKAFYTEEIRVIPPQYWVNYNNIIGVAFRSASNPKMAVSCNENGELSLLVTSLNEPGFVWFPEFVAENIVRLRSFYGGYLSFDANSNKLTCRARDKSFLTRWNVFINRDPKSQCLYLEAQLGAMGASTKDIQLLPVSSENANNICWVGDSTQMNNWREGNTYVYSFNSTLIQNLADYLNKGPAQPSVSVLTPSATPSPAPRRP